MATIIAFDTARSSRPSEPDRKPFSAQIVIFPGIRYERTPKPQDEPEPRAIAGRTRDRLSIPD